MFFNTVGRFSDDSVLQEEGSDNFGACAESNLICIRAILVSHLKGEMQLFQSDLIKVILNVWFHQCSSALSNIILQLTLLSKNF